MKKVPSERLRRLYTKFDRQLIKYGVINLVSKNIEDFYEKYCSEADLSSSHAFQSLTYLTFSCQQLEKLQLTSGEG